MNDDIRKFAELIAKCLKDAIEEFHKLPTTDEIVAGGVDSNE